ncbi:hypothetical protein ACCQ23_08070 [Xanthomonas axonopodis pv. phyllanthi]|uniref:hypothetical protein n=1 Tax=Xanthomonas axonopodis TaxID=53413 RepID=UPI003558D228
MLNLALILIAPTIGGALLYQLWLTRPARVTHNGLAVGQIPQRLRRRGAMAVRRAVTHG